MRWLESIPDYMDLSLGKLWETEKDREAWPAQFMGSQRVVHDLATEQQVFKAILKCPTICKKQVVSNYNPHLKR